MITSRQALSSVEQAILGVRRDEDRLTAMLRSATEETARLRARQAEAYKALARLKLDALAGKQGHGRSRCRRARRLAALEKGKTALAAIAKKRAALVDALAEGEKTLDDHADRLEKAIDAVDDLSEKTKARLAGDKAWVAARDKVETTEAMAAAAAEKAVQAEKDLAEKRKPYDADPIFTYLWQRGYGTSAYRAGFLARFFDAKLAQARRLRQGAAELLHAHRDPGAAPRSRDPPSRIDRRREERAGGARAEGARGRRRRQARGRGRRGRRCAKGLRRRARRDEGRARRARQGAGGAPRSRPATSRCRRRSTASPRRSPARTLPRSTRRRFRRRRRRTSASSPRSARSSRR